MLHPKLSCLHNFQQFITCLLYQALLTVKGLIGFCSKSIFLKFNLCYDSFVLNYSGPNTSAYTNKVLKLKLNLWSSLHLLYGSSHWFLHQNFGCMWQLNQKIKKMSINYTFMWLKYFLTWLPNLYASLRHILHWICHFI